MKRDFQINCTYYMIKTFELCKVFVVKSQRNHQPYRYIQQAARTYQPETVRGGVCRWSMGPPDFGTYRDLISEKGDFVILATLLWTPRNENPNGASVT